jgi:hypothetical protein
MGDVAAVVLDSELQAEHVAEELVEPVMLVHVLELDD